jgi:hypothetical protein
MFAGRRIFGPLAVRVPRTPCVVQLLTPHQKRPLSKRGYLRVHLVSTSILIPIRVSPILAPLNLPDLNIVSVLILPKDETAITLRHWSFLAARKSDRDAR